MKIGYFYQNRKRIEVYIDESENKMLE